VIPVPRATPHTVVPVPPATPHTVTPAPPATSSPTKLVLDANAASTYNPYNYPAQSFGDPARAIDGDNATAWTYTLDPTSAGKTAVGLVLDLKAPQKLRSVAVWTPSAGMTLELYGASGTLPLSIADPNWTHLATRRTLKAHERVPLKTQGRSFRYLLLWITHAPAGRATGTVGLSELSVFV
jgi:hypothetical protein